VPAGQYIIGITLPNGREIAASALTIVASRQTVKPAILLPNEAVQTEISSRANAVSLAMTEAMTAPNDPNDVAPVEVREVLARKWRGKWLGDWMTPQEAMTFVVPGGDVKLTESEQKMLPADDVDDDFLITRHKNSAGRAILRFTIVPHDECPPHPDGSKDARMILAALREGSSPPAVKYASAISDETNTLLNFVDAGVLGEMQTVAAAFMDAGTKAKDEQHVSLLRALTGAYIMLRVNTIDGLDAWLDRLEKMAPALPDTYTLRAELLARLGRHQEAALALRDAMHALCPWFRAGVSYMIERLKLYTDLDADTRATLNVSEADWALFARARHRLERLAPTMVVGQVFTTFDIPE
jgi:hypothetical protein